MKVRLALIFTALTAVPMLASAQATGTWAGEFTGGRGGRGPQMITVVLNADGTGTFQQGEQEPAELSEVMIDGNMVSFQRTLNFGGRGGGDGGGFMLTYAGEVDGDTMTLEISFEGGGGGGGGGFEQPPLVLTRQ